MRVGASITCVSLSCASLSCRKFSTTLMFSSFSHTIRLNLVYVSSDTIFQNYPILHILIISNPWTRLEDSSYPFSSFVHSHMPITLNVSHDAKISCSITFAPSPDSFLSQHFMQNNKHIKFQIKY